MFELLADPGRMLMFSDEVYRAVLAQYNRDTAVVVVLLVIAGVVLLAALARGARLPAAPVYSVLAAAWLWLGTVFHASYFATVNLAAQWLAVGALLQGVLLLQFAFAGGRSARVGGVSCVRAGLAWVAIALLFGPVAALAGTSWDASGYFATAPHTLGYATGAVLILTDRAPWRRSLPFAVLGLVDAATAILLGERAIAAGWLLLALTLVVLPWCRRRGTV